jgi:PAS domain S-box-containing protein
MENIYKIILEETLAGYWDYHVKENTVVLSPAFKAMFGYHDHELANSTDTWAKLIVKEDRPRMDKCVAEHYLSHGLKPYNIDVRYKHKNGSIIWINTTGRVIEWDGDEPVRMVGCHIDITKKKKTELSLEISEETFRNAFQYSSIGMVLVSIKGKFLKVNDSLCAMLGYAAQELISKTFQEITHPDDLEADLSLLQKTLNGELKNYQMEKRYFTKSGKVIWVVLNVSLVRDEDDALRESERRWAFASEGSGGGLWDWDIKNRTIFHSEQCLRMIGMENDNFGTVLGDWTSRVHPADKEKYLADLKKHLRGETEIYTNQHRVLCKDNTYKWILDRGKIMEYDENNKPLRVIGTHTDITEQKNKEEQLRESLDMVSGQNNRLLNFAYIVSHNLRTHASNFKTELSGHLIKVSEQLNDTITNLNEVVSIQTNIDIHTAEVNLHNYVEKAVELLSNDITMWKVEIDNRIPRDLILVYSPAYMESIMLNLLSNGIKYRSLTGAAKITIEYFEQQNGGHGFIVADNGIGIDLKKNGEELFGMYKTFHGNRDARGMGLFITKNQIESFGGKIEVSSELGKGTTFTVYLN